MYKAEGVIVATWKNFSVRFMASPEARMLHRIYRHKFFPEYDCPDVAPLGEMSPLDLLWNMLPLGNWLRNKLKTKQEYDQYDSMDFNRIADTYPLAFAYTPKNRLIAISRVVFGNKYDLPAISRTQNGIQMAYEFNSKAHVIHNKWKQAERLHQLPIQNFEIGRFGTSKWYQKNVSLSDKKDLHALLFLSAFKMAVQHHRARTLVNIFESADRQPIDTNPALYYAWHANLTSMHYTGAYAVSFSFLKMMENVAILPPIDKKSYTKEQLKQKFLDFTNVAERIGHFREHKPDMYDMVMGADYGVPYNRFSPESLLTQEPFFHYLLKQKGFQFDQNYQITNYRPPPYLLNELLF